MTAAYRRIAYLSKTHSKHGRLVALPFDGLPFLLEEDMEAYIVPPRLEGPRSYRVASVHEQGERHVVSFEGLETREEAESLVGRYCLVEASALPAFDEASRAERLRGFEVSDRAHGPLGLVVEVMSNPHQELLVVEGPYGRCLVPFVDEFIVSLDEVSRAIELSLPSGLIELAEHPDDH